MSNWQNDWSVIINGRDISQALRPYLISVSVTDKDGTESDSASVEADDTDGQFALPDENASIIIRLNRVKIFEGTIDKPRSKGNRGGGRTISIQAKGYDTKGKAKEVQALHKDDATLKDFMGAVAQKAGYSIHVDEELASIHRDYWAADHESFLHLGQRLGRELNATFKLQGKKATFVPRGKDLGLPTITGAYGKNLIDWDIVPLSGRSLHKSGKARWFNRETASYKTDEQDFGSDRNAQAVNQIAAPLADEAQAKQANKARKGESERGGGEGSVTIDADATARVEGLFVLVGARPGVDGTYRIVGVNQSGNRDAGTTTKLDLKQPSGAAGKDSR